MAQQYIPGDHQGAITRHVMSVPRCNVWSGMGTGKTAAILTAVDLADLVDVDAPVLVIAPLRVAKLVWPSEAGKWSHLGQIDVRAAVEGARGMVLSKDHRVTTINYDVLPWLIQNYSYRWRWRTVIADESTRLKSFRLKQGGVRAQALAKIAHTRVDRWINLTGTPAPNGLKDLWGQAWFLDEGKRLGRSFSAFEQRWFQNIADRPGGRTVMTPMPHAQAEIEGLLRDITLTVEAKNHFTLPPLIENVIEVELPPKARAIYRSLERDLFALLASGTEIVAANAGVKSMKCLQATAGALYTGSDGAWEELHDAKIKAIESVVEEAAGMPVLIAYQFKSDLARLQAAFPQGRVLDASETVIRDWNAGKIPILFAHPKSAGHGLNLQDGGNIIVFFSLWWALEDHEQIIERIGPTRQAQSGHDRPVFVHMIVARGTIDEDVLERLRTKASVQSILMSAMERRKHDV